MPYRLKRGQRGGGKREVEVEEGEVKVSEVERWRGGGGIGGGREVEEGEVKVSEVEEGWRDGRGEGVKWRREG